MVCWEQQMYMAHQDCMTRWHKHFKSTKNFQKYIGNPKHKESWK